ncbi:MAG: hypothetical protein HYZ75_00150 [Elusimicrobia bacterium]|nr:hypothetical protein [Elusimicrobiota bacterium]
MRTASLLLALLVTASVCPASEPDALFDRETVGVFDAGLLSERGYTFHADGLMRPPGGGAPVSREDASFLLEDLRSRRRLRDLLEIKLIRDRAASAGALSPEDKAALRRLAQRDWPILPKSAREDLKPLFSASELWALEEARPKAPPPQAELSAQPPAPPAVEPPSPPPTPPAAAAAVPAAPTPVAPAEEPVPEDIVALPAPWKSEAAPPPSPMAAFAPVVPSVIAPAVIAPPPAPLPSESDLGTEAETLRSLRDPQTPGEIGAARAMAGLPAAPPPPAVPAAPVAPVLVPIPVPAPAPVQTFRAEPAAPPPSATAEGMTPLALPAAQRPAAPAVSTVSAPAYPALSPEAFGAFLATAPYGRDEVALLTLIGANLPDPERSQTLGVLLARLPHVVLDSRRSGSGARTGLSTMASGGGTPREVVAVHDGPVFSGRDSLLASDRAWLLPDDPAMFTTRGLPAPSAQAFDRSVGSAGESATKWGRMRVYADGSRRMTRSQTAQAGALVNGLLLLDAQLRMPGDPYGAVLRAWTGEFRLYQALEKAGDKEPALDRELLALYREWRDRPTDFVDTIMHSMMSGDGGAGRILEDAGLGKAPPTVPTDPVLPRPGSAAERQWLESDKAARAAEEKQ